MEESYPYLVPKSRKTRIQQAEARTAQAETRIEHAKTRIEAAETRIEQAESRIESAKTRTEQAETRAEHAETRAEEAEHRVDQLEKLLETLAETPMGGSNTVEDEEECRALERLTVRQREVLELTAIGENTKEIAGNLNISSKTVEYHRKKLMTILGLKDITGLVRFALRVGLIPAKR